MSTSVPLSLSSVCVELGIKYEYSGGGEIVFSLDFENPNLLNWLFSDNPPNKAFAKFIFKDTRSYGFYRGPNSLKYLLLRLFGSNPL